MARNEKNKRQAKASKGGPEDSEPDSKKTGHDGAQSMTSTTTGFGSSSSSSSTAPAPAPDHHESSSSPAKKTTPDNNPAVVFSIPDLQLQPDGEIVAPGMGVPLEKTLAALNPALLDNGSRKRKKGVSSAGAGASSTTIFGRGSDQDNGAVPFLDSAAEHEVDGAAHSDGDVAREHALAELRRKRRPSGPALGVVSSAEQPQKLLTALQQARLQAAADRRDEVVKRRTGEAENTKNVPERNKRASRSMCMLSSAAVAGCSGGPENIKGGSKEHQGPQQGTTATSLEVQAAAAAAPKNTAEPQNHQAPIVLVQNNAHVLQESQKRISSSSQNPDTLLKIKRASKKFLRIQKAMLTQENVERLNDSIAQLRMRKAEREGLADSADEQILEEMETTAAGTDSSKDGRRKRLAGAPAARKKNGAPEQSAPSNVSAAPPRAGGRAGGDKESKEGAAGARGAAAAPADGGGGPAAPGASGSIGGGPVPPDKEGRKKKKKKPDAAEPLERQDYLDKAMMYGLDLYRIMNESSLDDLATWCMSHPLVQQPLSNGTTVPIFLLGQLHYSRQDAVHLIRTIRDLRPGVLGLESPLGDAAETTPGLADACLREGLQSIDRLQKFLRDLPLLKKPRGNNKTRGHEILGICDSFSVALPRHCAAAFGGAKLTHIDQERAGRAQALVACQLMNDHSVGHFLKIICPAGDRQSGGSGEDQADRIMNLRLPPEELLARVAEVSWNVLPTHRLSYVLREVALQTEPKQTSNMIFLNREQVMAQNLAAATAHSGNRPVLGIVGCQHLPGIVDALRKMGWRYG